MRNFDKKVLRRRQTQLDSPHPDVHQALRMALCAEFEARAFYRRMTEAYGARAPFPTLLVVAEKRVGWLTATGQKYGIATPLDSFATPISVSDSWLENCTRAVGGESALVRRYRSLGSHARLRALSNLFEKLLRQSLTRQIPLLLRAISAAEEQERFHASHGVPPEEAYLQHGLFSTLLEKAFSVLGADHRAIGLFSPVLRSTSPVLLAGALVGGATAFAFKKKTLFKRKEG